MRKLGEQESVMTIDEAIEHCLDNAEKERKNCNNDCAKEHEQLAEWLKELKFLKEQKGVMKIKKIQWGHKFFWNGCERHFKELPFNMTALVQETVQEFYAWFIRQGTRVIESGKADTMYEAKRACENAWESIVMEALEG